MLNQNSSSRTASDVSIEVGENIVRSGSKVLRIDWLGQTLASLCWIISVFVYGFSNGDGLQMSMGDWLQLAAASSWFIANMAALQKD